MKTILVTELNDHKKNNPNAKYYAKCAWGDWEVDYYDGSWLRRSFGGMGVSVTPTDKVEVR